MGTPLPPNRPGNPCLTCWGSGQRFGDGPTPHIVKVTLTGLLRGSLGSAALDTQFATPHLLEQGLAPCGWQITDDGILWTLTYSAQFSNLTVGRIVDNKRAFQDDFPPACELSIVNEIDDPDDRLAYDGIATISFP